MASDAVFKNVGVADISFTGKSVRLEIHHTPDPVLTKTYYVSREQMAEMLQGHRKETTIYTKEPSQAE